jgi:hypothetical protein
MLKNSAAVISVIDQTFAIDGVICEYGKSFAKGM